MSWLTPDRPLAQPIDPEDFVRRRTGGTVPLLISGAACLWVLLTRWGVIDFTGGGILWVGANVVAPYVALGIGGFVTLAGLLDRLLGGSYATLLKGLIPLVLGVLVLWPRYAPTGVLIESSEETVRHPDITVGRWVGGRFQGPYQNERILHCRYRSLKGEQQVTFRANRYAQECPFFNWPE